MSDPSPETLDLDALEKIQQEATPGPWAVARHAPIEVRMKREFSELGSEATGKGIGFVYDLEDDNDADARYIAAFDPPTTALLLRAARERYEIRRKANAIAKDEEPGGDDGRLYRASMGLGRAIAADEGPGEIIKRLEVIQEVIDQTHAAFREDVKALAEAVRAYRDSGYCNPIYEDKLDAALARPGIAALAKEPE